VSEQPGQTGMPDKPRPGRTIGPMPRASARWFRVLLLGGLSGGIGVGTLNLTASAEINHLVGATLGIVAGAVLGLVAGLGLFAAEERKLREDRELIIRRIRKLSSVDRGSNFDVLRAIDSAHPYAEICSAVHAALCDAHRDRLEAAMLRRDLEDRVVKTASRQTVHLTRLSLTDELTGLANRRGFDQGLEAMIDQALRERLELCLLAFDLDHFKQLNDTMGHDKGDLALIAAGEIIRAHVREDDLGARVGGDEMFFAMLGLSIADAERIGARIMDLFRVHPEGVGLPCPWPGMSVGIAGVQTHGARDAATLRRMADAALYTAKRAGRGRISLYSHLGGEEGGQRSAA